MKRNRDIINDMALIDLLDKINNGITGCIFSGLDKSHEYQCGKYGDGKTCNCYDCISEWLNIKVR